MSEFKTLSKEKWVDVKVDEAASKFILIPC